MFQMIKRGKSQPSLEEVMCLKDEPILNGNKQDMAMIDTLVTFPGVDLIKLVIFALGIKDNLKNA